MMLLLLAYLGALLLGGLVVLGAWVLILALFSPPKDPLF